MPLTLIEAAKGAPTLFERGVIQTFTDGQRLAQVIPYDEITGSADGIEREVALPDADSRGINEAFTESTGRTEEIIQSLKIYGGDIGIDAFILATKGSIKATTQITMKIQAIANKWTLDFFKGDMATNPRDIDGLQNRLDIGTINVVEAGSTDGGDALGLTVLDEAIARCHGPRFIAVGRQMAVLFTQAMRNQSFSGVLSRDRNELGFPTMFYNGLELIMVTDNSNNDNILDFSEVGSGGATATASSVYIFGVGDQGILGIQNGTFRVRNLGEDNATPRDDTRVEWYQNYHIMHPRAVIRVRGISNASFVS